MKKMNTLSFIIDNDIKLNENYIESPNDIYKEILGWRIIGLDFSSQPGKCILTLDSFESNVPEDRH